MEELLILGLLAGGGYLVYKQTQSTAASSSSGAGVSTTNGVESDLLSGLSNGTTAIEDLLDGSGGVDYGNSNPAVTTTNGTESDLTTSPQNDALNNLLASSDPLSSGDPTL